MSGTQCYGRRGSRPPESALVFVIVSPITNYFAAGTGPLRLLVSDEERAVAGIGATKAGADYASNPNGWLSEAVWRIRSVLLEVLGSTRDPTRITQTWLAALLQNLNRPRPPL